MAFGPVLITTEAPTRRYHIFKPNQTKTVVSLLTTPEAPIRWFYLFKPNQNGIAPVLTALEVQAVTKIDSGVCGSTVLDQIGVIH